MEQTSIKRQKTKIKKSQQPGKLPDMQENAMLCHQTNYTHNNENYTLCQNNPNDKRNGNPNSLYLL